MILQKMINNAEEFSQALKSLNLEDNQYWKAIQNLNKEEEFVILLEHLYPSGITEKDLAFYMEYGVRGNLHRLGVSEDELLIAFACVEMKEIRESIYGD